MTWGALRSLVFAAAGTLIAVAAGSDAIAQSSVPKPRGKPDSFEKAPTGQEQPAVPAEKPVAPKPKTGDGPVSKKPVVREADEAAASQTAEGRSKLEQCVASLKRLGAAVRMEPPFKTEGGCGIDDPVALSTLRVAGAKVTLSGSPKLSCRFALKFVDWTVNVVAPVARFHLGSDVRTLLTGPGYVCRRRNNSAKGKLSEHALGNAIDITGFKLNGGERVMISGLKNASGAVKKFVGAMRVSGCGYFTTVLGPGADAAHEDHIHFDLGRHGRTDRYRICQ